MDCEYMDEEVLELVDEAMNRLAPQQIFSAIVAMTEALADIDPDGLTDGIVDWWCHIADPCEEDPRFDTVHQCVVRALETLGVDTPPTLYIMD